MLLAATIATSILLSSCASLYPVLFNCGLFNKKRRSKKAALSKKRKQKKMKTEKTAGTKTREGTSKTYGAGVTSFSKSKTQTRTMKAEEGNGAGTKRTQFAIEAVRPAVHPQQQQQMVKTAKQAPEEFVLDEAGQTSYAMPASDPISDMIEPSECMLSEHPLATESKGGGSNGKSSSLAIISDLDQFKKQHAIASG